MDQICLSSSMAACLVTRSGLAWALFAALSCDWLRLQYTNTGSPSGGLQPHACYAYNHNVPRLNILYQLHTPPLWENVVPTFRRHYYPIKSIYTIHRIKYILFHSSFSKFKIMSLTLHCFSCKLNTVLSN